MKAKKKYGQNFLIDKQVLNNIGDSINATEEDLIIEIGPGMGALTRVLKEKKSNLICFEIDRDLIPTLKSLEDSKTKIINEDILKVDFKNIISQYSFNKLYIVGNLPYYITTPIIKHIIDSNVSVNEMVFMVQNEVADRFTSLPGNKEYGSITLFLKYYFNIEKLFVVSKTSFFPSPKVESAIIRLKKRENMPVVDTDMYFKLVNDAFKQKRKTLKNNLCNYDFNKINKVLVKNDFTVNVRAEELSEDIFIEILCAIKEDN